MTWIEDYLVILEDKLEVAKAGGSTETHLDRLQDKIDWLHGADIASLLEYYDPPGTELPYWRYEHGIRDVATGEFISTSGRSQENVAGILEESWLQRAAVELGYASREEMDSLYQETTYVGEVQYDVTRWTEEKDRSWFGLAGWYEEAYENFWGGAKEVAKEATPLDEIGEGISEGIDAVKDGIAGISAWFGDWWWVLVIVLLAIVFLFLKVKK